MKLLDFASNVYSQHGEDGMIAQVLKWIGMEKGHAVEFGAWDGHEWANTALLWEHGWSATLIEGGPNKFKELKENTKDYPEVKVINQWVTLEDGSRWQDLSPPADVVSIDVDGNDYWLFQESPAGPALYIVEYNSTLPAWFDITTPYDKDNYFGCSLGALCRVATEKGYIPIGATRSNGFFLRSDFMLKLPLDLQFKLHEAPNNSDLSYVITDYAGNFTFTRGPCYGFKKPYSKEVMIVCQP